MYKRGILLFISLLGLIACKESAKKEPIKEKTEDVAKTNISDAFSIEILDNEALSIIDSTATIQVLAEGFTWTEGPVWIQEGKFLLFSDIPNNKVFKLDSLNKVSVYLHPSGFLGPNPDFAEPGSNGLTLDNDGNLVLMQHGERRVGKMNAPLSDPKPDYIALVDNYKGKRFNSPNDGFFDAGGNLYFTDPPYGLPKRMEDETKELDFQGIYCLLKSGELKLLDKEVPRPNGIAQSPDGKTLYVAVSHGPKVVWHSYDIMAPGKVKNKQTFYDVTELMGKEGWQGAPDGLKVNSKGYIFATGPGGVWIFNKDAKVLARILTGQRTSNCALTSDEKRLFMTADDYILSVNLK
ncbi:SMP-30/gluconolactonase/LRE family protein [Seonamhaeicola sp.]|uniref:SMP-30/gluconolactonase/LRE family protein n=1 Tax=Seonamhaeicola sp. TaxID=1912245 RepID=UPI002629EFFD|nr:SMP-30/gluconolactonase/LRE family protein [Seonamhaeicola sp.]